MGHLRSHPTSSSFSQSPRFLPRLAADLPPASHPPSPVSGDGMPAARERSRGRVPKLRTPISGTPSTATMHPGARSTGPRVPSSALVPAGPARRPQGRGGGGRAGPASPKHQSRPRTRDPQVYLQAGSNRLASPAWGLRCFPGTESESGVRNVGDDGDRKGRAGRAWETKETRTGCP